MTIKKLNRKLDQFAKTVKDRNNKEGKGKNAITFVEALTLVFLHLKLSDNINWSWWIVLLPIYGMISLNALKHLLDKYSR